MKTDLVIKFDLDSGSFTLYLKILGMLGSVKQVRVKKFDHEFHANHVQFYCEDWNTWRLATKEELEKMIQVKRDAKPV